MGMRDPRVLVVDASLSDAPEVGRWIWALQDTRRRTLEQLEGLTQTVVDWAPPDGGSTIGTVLYHLALIEADWLYSEVLELPYPPEALALFPYADRDAQGQLLAVGGIELGQHLARLDTVRQWLLATFQPMSLAEFRRVRTLPQYEVTPEWVLHHLMQHEAEHRGQIGTIRALVGREG
jgi:uncharacterized damage-inducible protein DinB